MEKYSHKDLTEFRKMFEIRSDLRYKILDTAGICLSYYKTKLFFLIFKILLHSKDYIIPPSEYNAVFIMSNYIEVSSFEKFKCLILFNEIIYHNVKTAQTQSTCDEVIYFL